jgi:DNA polymerase-4
MDNFKITKKIRLIGVGTSGFSSVASSVQIGLFDRDDKIEDEWEKVDKTLDSISKKFGKDVVGRATLKNK